MSFKRLYPSEYYESAYIIDYEALYAEGYRGIIYDIDNTLVPHGYPADERALELMERLKNIGYKITFLSNNKEPRVVMFNEKIGAGYICKAGKPSAAGYIKAASDMGCNTDTTLFVGDQIFTDIWGANRAGIKSFLVVPIGKSTDEIQIVLKRVLEKVIIKNYLRKNKLITKKQEKDDM